MKLPNRADQFVLSSLRSVGEAEEGAAEEKGCLAKVWGVVTFPFVWTWNTLTSAVSKVWSWVTGCCRYSGSEEEEKAEAVLKEEEKAEAVLKSARQHARDFLAALKDGDATNNAKKAAFDAISDEKARDAIKKAVWIEAGRPTDKGDDFAGDLIRNSPSHDHVQKGVERFIANQELLSFKKKLENDALATSEGTRAIYKALPEAQQNRVAHHLYAEAQRLGWDVSEQDFGKKFLTTYFDVAKAEHKDAARAAVNAARAEVAI
jgi:hypothetical protein